MNLSCTVICSSFKRNASENSGLPPIPSKEMDVDSEDDSDYEAFSDSNSQSSTLMIPTKPSEMAPIANFKTVCCYGCKIEFPDTKTPFPSQMSVMTAVRSISVAEL